MASTFEFSNLFPPGALQPGALATVPNIPRAAAPRYRIRDLCVAAIGPGAWPSHTERAPELYLIVSGEVIYQMADRRLVLRAGMGVLFETGDSHATEVPHGVVSISMNLLEA
jgi:mannose-6-phosphate isomerase-like protein (cupin superfamily)